MPRYVYKCLDCKCLFEVTHHHQNTQDVCLSCESREIYKYLGTPINVRKEASFKKTGKNNTGTVVNSTIEELKTDLKREKEFRKKNA
jgi:predicted nucleic acid-binding Zn ribbon protein